MIIVSAFVGAKALDSLLDAAKRVAERRLYVRWDLNDIATGASDWESWDVARSHHVPMYACPKLHAKLYIADDKVLIGSANATTPGLSGPSNGNLELLVLEDAEIDPVKEIVLRIQESSVLANPLGKDIALRPTSKNGNTEILIWLPKSDPSRFLRVMAGEISHDEESRQDKSSLRLTQSVVGRAENSQGSFVN